MVKGVLWEYEDPRGARVFLSVSDANSATPKYELAIDSSDPEYLANELLVELGRTELMELWAVLEEHTSDG